MIFLAESLKDNSERLILSLEDCTSARQWNESEVSTLLHIGRLIFTAVNNDNTINRLKPKEKN